MAIMFMCSVLSGGMHSLSPDHPPASISDTTADQKLRYDLVWPKIAQSTLHK